MIQLPIKIQFYTLMSTFILQLHIDTYSQTFSYNIVPNIWIMLFVSFSWSLQRIPRSGRKCVACINTKHYYCMEWQCISQLDRSMPKLDKNKKYSLVRPRMPSDGSNNGLNESWKMNIHSIKGSRNDDILKQLLQDSWCNVLVQVCDFGNGMEAASADAVGAWVCFRNYVWLLLYMNACLKYEGIPSRETENITGWRNS